MTDPVTSRQLYITALDVQDVVTKEEIVAYLERPDLSLLARKILTRRLQQLQQS